MIARHDDELRVNPRRHFTHPAHRCHGIVHAVYEDDMSLHLFQRNFDRTRQQNVLNRPVERGPVMQHGVLGNFGWKAAAHERHHGAEKRSKRTHEQACLASKHRIE
jgi:hypothetical protein